MFKFNQKHKIQIHDGRISAKRSLHLMVVIVVPVAIIGVIAWYFIGWDTKKEDNVTSVSTTTTIYDETNSWVKLANSEYGFEMRYMDDIFSKEAYTASFQPYLAKEIEGTKLISKFRVSLIGNQQCFYGQSGEGTVCNVAHEGGITVVPMSRTDLDTIVSKMSKNIAPTEKNISGKTAHVFSAGAEGEGEDSYFIEINETQGLLVSRVYVDTFKPDAKLFERMLGTLKFTK